jgi:hypothetical protein
MASTIILSDNGASSGSAGLKETGGNDGVLILQTTTSGGTATNAVYVDNTQKVGFGATPGTARVTIAAANAVTASRGTAYLYTTDSMAANLGGQLSFGGSYTGTSETIFGAVAGRKENGTGADISGYLQLSTTNAALGLVERARIDSSGNLLLGTTTQPYSAKVARSDDANSVVQSILVRNQNAGSSASCGYFLNGYGNSWGIEMGSTAKNSNALTFTVDALGTPVEKMRLDTSGNLLVGATSQINGEKVGVTFDGLTQNGIVFKTTYGSIGSVFAQFRTTSSAIGNITQNGASTVSYATSSDYRLKENVQPMTAALSVVQQLKPCTYKWKADGSNGQGFIAHELAEVVPDCVTGEKDAVDDSGNPVYQGIDTSFLVATLTAAIQEQQALITTLTERITALEAK